MRRHDIRAKTIQMKLRYSDFHTITRSLTLAEPTDITQEINVTALKQLTTELPRQHAPVRLLGVGVCNLVHTGKTQRLLFGEENRQKQRNLDNVTDEILKRFGRDAVSRGRMPGRISRDKEPGKQ